VIVGPTNIEVCYMSISRRVVNTFVRMGCGATAWTATEVPTGSALRQLHWLVRPTRLAGGRRQLFGWRCKL